jgi:hypothetical protein
VEWDRLDLLGDRRDRVVRRYAAFLGEETGAVGIADAAAAPLWRSRRGIQFALLLAGAAIPLVVALVYVLGEVGWGSGESRSRGTTPPPPPASPTEAVPRRTEKAQNRPAPPKRRTKPAPPARAPVRLVLTAALGDSWVEARAGSPTGPLLYNGTLAGGQTVRLSSRRLWVRLGAASNLAFTLNGKPADADLHGTVDVLITPQGIQPA